MSSEIIKVLDALSDKLGIAVDWTSGNVLPYLQQLCDKCVKYEMVSSIIWIIVGIGLLIGCAILIKLAIYCYKKYNESDGYSEWDFVYMLVVILAITTGISGIIVIITQLFDIAMCITFPEKIIIDELRNIYLSLN